MNIPVVVNKNDADGNFCKTEDAEFFVNKEPIARTVTCKCGGGAGCPPQQYGFSCKGSRQKPRKSYIKEKGFTVGTEN